jgi:hypothetical protein
MIDLNEPHPTNTTSPILVTLGGIVKDVSEEQFQKRPYSKLVRLLGNTIEVKDVQCWNAT